jgi:Fe-S oxidoreductase
MTVVLVLGLLMNAIALPIAGKRVLFLERLITSGQPAPDRLEGVRGRIGRAVKTQLVEVLGQKKLLKWTVPGAAHFFVFWAFLILATVYFEAYAVLVSRDAGWHWLVFNNWAVLGFAQDLISVLCLVSLAVFTWIRIKNAPQRLGRKSRFDGSHLSGAWITLIMIFNVIWTLLLFRGAVSARDIAEGKGNGYGKAAFVSHLLGKVLPDNTTLIGVGLLLHIGVMLVFLVFVLNSKHLHIFVAPLNVLFSRRPNALGAIKPIMIKGEPLNLEAMDDLEEEDFEKLGIGKIEDFSWKGMLDFATCTECGRCQSQCPAWNTEKPLSPKLLIMELRDHAFAKAPYILADSDDAKAKLPAATLAEAERALVGPTEGNPSQPSGGAVIDPDVLWSCVSCGACVEQCPVDIEHVDHIMDMRRYQVLVESNFPSELNNIFKGLERKGNPWGMDPKGRMDWAKNLDFEVKQVGVDVEDLDEVEWLFWVGCAGAYEDRAKKTTQAVAELLDMAGVSFAVLGDGETCTGDPARRAGNEVVFAQLAMQNAEVFKETKVKKVVSTCAHCFNTLKNEYAEFGVELEVVHHTQLLNRLVREGKLTPLAPDAETEKKKITYHDPCFIGRHNKVYEPPRELLSIIPGAEFTEMPRNQEKSFCCGAGGAQMWMEETIGTRINVNRTKEAVATGADQIAVACPFCRVMLSDGLTAEQSEGNAREEVEVLDVAQMLLAGVKRAPAKVAKVSKADDDAVVAEAEAATAAAATTVTDKATEAEPDAEDKANPDSISETEDAAPAADAAEEAETGGDPETAHEDKARSDEDEAVHDVPAGDKEAAAQANVGPVNTGDDDKTEAKAEQVEDEKPAEPEAAESKPEDEAAAPDVPAGDKEAAAWANVGPVNTDSTPEAKSEPSGSTPANDDPADADEGDPEDAEPVTEAEPAEPAKEAGPDEAEAEEAPAEKVTHVPDEKEPVEEDAREEEAEAAGTEAKADIPDGKIVAVEDAPSTSDPVSEDSAPLSDANPSGADLSKAATDAAEEGEQEDEGDAKP